MKSIYIVIKGFSLYDILYADKIDLAIYEFSESVNDDFFILHNILCVELMYYLK